MNRIHQRVKFSIVALFFTACAPDVSQQLLGEWSGVDSHDNHQTFVFHQGNTVTWIIAHAGTLNVTYRFEPGTRPFQLDLLGFTDPPLENKTLFGILEFDGNSSFRFDCEAGPANRDGGEIRPAFFTKDAVTYNRAE